MYGHKRADESAILCLCPFLFAKGENTVKSFKQSSQTSMVCPECMTAHPPDTPHYKDSVFYQCVFHSKHGRWPTWKDASAHCSNGAEAVYRIEIIR